MRLLKAIMNGLRAFGAVLKKLFRPKRKTVITVRGTDGATIVLKQEE